MRERVAGLLHNLGALGAVMRLRRFAPMSTLGIVTYHHIEHGDPGYAYDPDVADATPEQFRRHMETLARYCTLISIDDLIRGMRGGSLPKNAAMVTFDDGYRSCHDVALPILRSVGVPAVFFVSTSFITERRLYWWERIALLLSGAKRDRASIRYPVAIDLDRREASTRRQLTGLVKNTAGLDIDRFLDELGTAFGVAWSPALEAEHANRLIMTWDQVRALARAGMDVESHGRRHRVLQTLDQTTLEDELAGSRTELEAQLGRPVRAIAYPVGRRILEEERLVRAVKAAGYEVGMSNASGVNRLLPPPLRRLMSADPYDIRRLATDRQMSDAMFLTQIAVPDLAYSREQTLPRSDGS